MEDTFETLLLNLGGDTPVLTVSILFFMFLRNIWPDVAEVLKLYASTRAESVACQDVEGMVEKRTYDAVAMASTLLTSAPMLLSGQPSVSPTADVRAGLQRSAARGASAAPSGGDRPGS